MYGEFYVLKLVPGWERRENLLQLVGILFSVTHLDLLVPATSWSRGIQTCFDEALCLARVHRKKEKQERVSGAQRMLVTTIV